MKTKIFYLVFLISFFVFPLKAQSDLVAKFSAGTFSIDNFSIVYRIFIPDNYDSSKKYPLIFALHGSGERGSDNLIQIQLNGLATSWVDSLNQSNNPCFVLVPQCPLENDWWWGDSLVFLCITGLLDSTIKNYSIDTNRLYLTGLSMGGYGTWLLLETFPDKFAAAIPMSSGWDPQTVKKYKDVPVWNFHGQADPTVNIIQSRDMMDMYETLNSTVIYTNSKYRQVINLSSEQIKNHIKSHSNPLNTEYPGKGHVIWVEPYGNPLLHQWLFSKYKLTPGAIVLSNLKSSDEYEVLKTAYSINWNSINQEDSVEIWFSQNGGNSWDLIQSQVNSGSYDWDVSKVQDCSLGKIRILLKDSSENVYGIDESGMFAVNNDAVNAAPLVQIISRDFIKSSTIKSDSINLQLLIADPEKDSVTISLFASYDNGISYKSFDSFRECTQIDTVERMVYLNELLNAKKTVIKAVISDNSSMSADSTLYFSNTKGFITGIVELTDENAEIGCYPNPCKDVLNLELNMYNKEASIYIFDMMGKNIRIIQMDNLDNGLNHISIDLTNVQPGAYFLIIDKGDSKVYSKKINIL